MSVVSGLKSAGNGVAAAARTALRALRDVAIAGRNFAVRRPVLTGAVVIGSALLVALLFFRRRQGNQPA